MHHHRVQIASDGDPINTVVSLVDGPPISGVHRLTFDAEVGHVSFVTLEIAMPIALVQGQVNEVIFECPVCSGTLSHNCASTRD